MPELPDLLYIQKYLQREVVGRSITNITIREPIVLRVTVDDTFQNVLTGKTIRSITLHGPFITLGLSDSYDLVMNLVLMGKLQHQRAKEKSLGHLCFSLELDDASRVNFCDDQKMAKAYVVRHGEYGRIPRYNQQGTDILSPAFTLGTFRELAKRHSRKQVRVFINDHTIMSAIGNAYADEILFEARIHPKPFVARLSPDEIQRLHQSILTTMKWGIEKVELAHEPIHVKVRDHMRVRNRKGQPCPRCSTTIRREGVHGHDVFFCPSCQPASRKLFIDWKS